MKEKIYILVAVSNCLQVCIGIYKTKKEAEKACNEINELLDKLDSHDERIRELAFEKLDKYLISYYGGCGSFTAKVKEVSFGEAFAWWSLD